MRGIPPQELNNLKKERNMFQMKGEDKISAGGGGGGGQKSNETDNLPHKKFEMNLYSQMRRQSPKSEHSFSFSSVASAVFFKIWKVCFSFSKLCFVLFFFFSLSWSYSQLAKCRCIGCHMQMKTVKLC